MNDYEKLEYIHSYLQEVENGHADCGMLPHAIAFIEDIREKHPQAPWQSKDMTYPRPYGTSERHKN
jgi:hypothetical protein